MVQAEMDLPQARHDWKVRIEKSTSKMLDGTVKETMGTLKRRFKELGRAEAKNYRVDLDIPNDGLFEPSSQGSMTRLKMDGGVVGEIRGIMLRYSKDTGTAVSNVRLSADAQCWSVEMFDSMLTALEQKSARQSNSIRSRLEIYNKALNGETVDNLAGVTNYEGLVSAANMLRRELILATRHIGLYLENAASNERSRLEKLRRQ